MTDFKRLSEEMSKLKKQIKTVLDVSKYEESDADDMAGVAIQLWTSGKC